MAQERVVEATTCFQPGELISWDTVKGTVFARVIAVEHPKGSADRLLLDDGVSPHRYWKTLEELMSERIAKVDVMFLVEMCNRLSACLKKAQR